MVLRRKAVEGAPAAVWEACSPSNGEQASQTAAGATYDFPVVLQWSRRLENFRDVCCLENLVVIYTQILDWN